METSLKFIMSFKDLSQEAYKKIDKLYANAILSERARTIFPMNAHGTPSTVKTVLSKIKPLTAPLFSPVLQAGASAGLGELRNQLSPMINQVLPAKAGALGTVSKKAWDRLGLFDEE